MGSDKSKKHEVFLVAPAQQVEGGLVKGASEAGAAGLGGLKPVSIGPTEKVAPKAAVEVEKSGGGVEQPAVEDDVDQLPVPSVPSHVAALVSVEWADDDVITPIPDVVTVGDGVGFALAVGGADLEGGSATLYSFATGDGAQEVLSCILTAEAEQKMLDALAPPKPPTIEVHEEQVVVEPVALDVENNLAGQLVVVATSINSHRKKGTQIPAHTVNNLKAVADQVGQLRQQHLDGTVEADMLDYYQAHVAACQERLQPGFDKPYDGGGRIPTIEGYTHEVTKMVTVMKPDPSFVAAGAAIEERHASRMDITLNAGKSYWSGERVKAYGGGTEYVVDLGDGYTAVVRPSTKSGVAKSLRNAVELIAPPGPGHQHGLVAKMAKLNLVNRPMTVVEAEWVYLQRNVYAHELANHSAVVRASQQAVGIEEAYVHQLLTQRGHQAIGMDDVALDNFARQLQLDAEVAAMPDKTRVLRNGIAQALGYTDGATLRAQPGYHPIPTTNHGWLTWSRIGQTPEVINQHYRNRQLTHRVTGGNLKEVILSGALLSTERRKFLGVKKGIGASENQDQGTGGARSVFLRNSRVGTAKKPGTMIWAEPGRLLANTDWYAYNGDQYGSMDGHGQSRNPAVTADFHQSSNEIMIHSGLDILGRDAPTSICCSSPDERNEILTALSEAGVTMIGNKPAEQVLIL